MAIAFAGRIVLVTGAGRGLGRAYARLLAAREAHVVVHDAGVTVDGAGGDPTVAHAVVDEIRAAGGAAEALVDDLGTASACRGVVASVLDAHGRLDALIHSAGIVGRAELALVDDETFHRVVAVNGAAAFHLVRAALPEMSRRAYGRIVLTVSGHGLYPGDDVDLVPYGIGKAMQFGLMNAVAAHAAESGVLVNAISPVAATRMLSRDVAAGELPPESVAAAVAFLASDACDIFGVVVRAAGNRFSIGRYCVSPGVTLPNADPEAVAAAWPQIAGGDLAAAT